MDLSTQDLSFLDKILKDMAIDQNEIEQKRPEKQIKKYKPLKSHYDFKGKKERDHL